MKKNDESLSQREIQNAIDALVSINRLEERGIGTKSYFIRSTPDAILAPQTPIIDEIAITVDNTQKD